MVAAVASDPGSTRPLLSLDGVSKAFGGVRAADAVSLDLEEGAMLCVVGPNGCGKTTLFNLITGAVRPDAGTIRFDGGPAGAGGPVTAARRGILRKFQVPAVFDEMTPREAVALAQSSPAARARPAGTGTGGLADDPDALLAAVGLADRADTPSHALPHGARQWLEIALVLACRPRLMLLDEPTAGMTRAETRAAADLLRRLQDETGVTTILIEHDMAFVERLDRPVAVMIRGRLVAHGSYREVAAQPAVREAYLGAAAPAPAPVPEPAGRA
ncbi:MAG: ATP-binding cassette domain-containing protein [Azospirillaceae bacterium]